jgi:porin
MLLRAILNSQNVGGKVVSVSSNPTLWLLALMLSSLTFAPSISVVYAADSQVAVVESAKQESPVEEAAAAASDSIEERSYLLGDLGRSSWSEAGYRLDVLAINDLFANTTGGNQRGGGIMGSLNAILTIDTATAGWWDDGELVLYGVGIYGRRPSKVVGDYQWTDSFEGLDTIEPYQAYYQHAFADGRVKFLAGIVDYTLEFAVANYSFAFINSSFWTPSTITQIPYSFWPNTGLGARILAKPSDDTYLLAGVYDAKPTDFDRVRAVDLELSARDGAYSITELGFETADEKDLYTKLGFGAWYSSGEFTDAMGEERSSNYGTYVVGQRELWREAEGSDQGLGAFFHLGTAKKDRNFNSAYVGGGVRYKGFFEHRDQDVLGAGVAIAKTSEAYRAIAPETDSTEQAFELFYRIQVVPSVALTPDIQYVRNPGMNPAYDDAVVLYVRSEVML